MIAILRRFVFLTAALLLLGCAGSAEPDAPAKLDGMETIDFSTPNQSPVAPKSPKPSSPSEARSAPVEPQGGVSLDMKWHATNDKADPFDSVRHTSSPNGPGDAVEGGFKLGF